jgi:hypothetical protein
MSRNLHQGMPFSYLRDLIPVKDFRAQIDFGRYPHKVLRRLGLEIIVFVPADYDVERNKSNLEHIKGTTPEAWLKRFELDSDEGIYFPKRVEYVTYDDAPYLVIWVSRNGFFYLACADQFSWHA